ncbi:MAG: HNH endonuclease signature motif containing protein [Bacteroidales bacterium]|nr:HNH endonuclease signature motif containing protein [Bacteroidales bacterium]
MGKIALERAERIAKAVVKRPLQLGFPLEPSIEIAGEQFPLDDIAARFWPKVKQTDGCWLWLGAKDSDGYGSIKIGNHRGTHAHRIAYALKVGHIPTGLSVLHSCDNPSCVRPDHLFLGTQLDNVNDMAKKGRDHKAMGDRNASRLYPEKRLRGERHPFRLHPDLHARGERAANAKLKEGQVIEIRRSWEARELSQHALARKYGVTLATVNSIVLGKTWRHLL